MTAFTIAVYDPSGAAVIVPGNLDVAPQSWSAQAIGGMWDADVLVNGALDHLAGLTAWLGYRVEIINATGTAVWWGDVASVEITAGGARRGISLDRMANRIILRYAQPQPGGQSVAADTAWADDALSQARYGVWERRISPERTMSAAEATTRRTTALAALAQPYYTLIPDAGEAAAHLYCTGYWQRTQRSFYTNLTGLEENNLTGTAMPLGLGFTSNVTAFANRGGRYTIWNKYGYFAHFANDWKVKITGAANGGNNATFTIAGTDDRDAFAYVATTISFDPADDITDTADGLSFLATDDVFEVEGAGANNDTYILKSADANHIQISPAYSGDIVSAAAGASVTLTRGNHIEVTPATVNEHTGASGAVVATAYGQRYYQTFTLAVNAGSWTVDAVELRLRRVGGPTDGVTVQLVADSGGSPGTFIEAITVAADDIPLDMNWVSFAFANTHALNYGSTYGLVVLRTAGNEWNNYYEVDVDDGATYSRGAMKLYDGAAWQTPSPACDLIFRVLGAVDTGTQAAAAIQSQSWALVVDGVASGLHANQYRVGELKTADEVTAWLDLGTSTGLRLLAAVRRNLTAQIYIKPFADTARFVLQADGQLRDLYGQPADPGYLPAGEWVHLGDRADLGPWTALSPVFVERAEYRVSGGLSLEPEGAGDVWAK